MKINHLLKNKFWQLLTGLMLAGTFSVQAQTNSSVQPPAGTAGQSPVISAAVATNPPPSVSAIEVQSGDTFYALARRFKLPTAALQAVNPGVNPLHLSIGQKLNLPDGCTLEQTTQLDELHENDVAQANAAIATARTNGADWVKEPLNIALHFSNQGLKNVEKWECNGVNISIKLGNPRLMVTIRTEVEQDDSISSMKTLVELEKDAADHWKLVRLADGFACWPERGHTNYTCVPCL
ncbi:MAG: LysM domain-containing protein [Verrucomicrobiota bacterium]